MLLFCGKGFPVSIRFRQHRKAFNQKDPSPRYNQFFSHTHFEGELRFLYFTIGFDDKINGEIVRSYAELLLKKEYEFLFDKLYPTPRTQYDKAFESKFSTNYELLSPLSLKR
jgi:hypothetical protein